MKRSRVLVLGGGFAGLYACTYLSASELPEESVDITLISENNYFTFRPLLPEVVAGSLGREEVVFPLRVFAARYGFGFLQASIERIDLEKQLIQAGKETIAYDYVVIALGSKANYFGNNALSKLAMPLTTIAEAQAIRDRIIQKVEQAANERCKKSQQEILTIAVAGAGPAGVEVAGEIHHLLDNILDRYYGLDIKPRIIIYQGADRILAGWDDELAAQGLELLRKRGIEVNLKTRVKDFDGKRVTAFSDGQDLSVDTDTLIWTAGAQPATALFDHSGLIVGSAGHIQINQYLAINGYENAFAVGDMASLKARRSKQPYPPVAPIAISQGIRAAANIENAIMGRNLEPYHAHHAGKIVSLGGGVALVDMFGWRLTGFSAWLIYRTVYLLKLVGVKNKLRAAVTLFLNHFFEPDITCDKKTNINTRR